MYTEMILKNYPTNINYKYCNVKFKMKKFKKNWHT